MSEVTLAAPEPENEFTRLKNVPRTEADLAALAETAEQHYATFQKTLTRLNADLALQQRNATADAERFTHLPQTERQRLATEAMRDKRKQILANSDAERIASLRDLKAAADLAEQAEPLFRSPVQMLAGHNLGSLRRAQIYAEASKMGPMALANAARQFAVAGDKEGGAALLTVIDALPTHRRPFVAQDLAEVLIGPAYRAATNHLAVIKNRFREAFNQNREFDSGRINGVSRIATALARRREAPKPKPE